MRVINVPQRFLPWTVEALDGGFKIVDANGQTLADAACRARDAEIAKSLTLYEARRIASNIANLPTYLAKNMPAPASVGAPFAIISRYDHEKFQP